MWKLRDTAVKNDGLIVRKQRQLTSQCPCITCYTLAFPNVLLCHTGSASHTDYLEDSSENLFL